MMKKYAAFLLFALVVNVISGYSVSAQTQNSDAESLRKLKIKVAKIYSQPRGRIIVKYNDGTKLKGYLTEVKDDTFGVTETKTGNVTNIQYAQVKSVNKIALPPIGKVLIVAAASFGVLLILTAIAASQPGF